MKEAILALALDTEGCISMNIFRRRNTNHFELEPVILVFSNNSKELMAYIYEIAKNIFPNLRFSKSSQDTRIFLYGSRQCLIFLEKLSPYLIRTRSTAEIALKLMRERKSKQHQRYTQEEINLVLQIRKRPLKSWAIELLERRGYKI